MTTLAAAPLPVIPPAQPVGAASPLLSRLPPAAPVHTLKAAPLQVTGGGGGGGGTRGYSG